MVTIPRLQRIAPSKDLPSNRRIQAKAQDQSANILQRGKQISALGERAVEINRAYEDSKIDSLSSEANQKYAEWNVQKLQELKNHKGDPTDAYAQYDVEEKEFFDNVLGDKPDINERVRKGLTANLAKSQNSNRIKVLKQRGFQKEVYEHNLFTSDLDLNKQELSVSASYIEKGDKTSTIQFNEGLNNIRTLVAKNAIRTGTAEEIEDDAKGDHRYKDADGNEIRVKLSNAAKAKTYTEMNKGVVNSVDVLIASGKTGEARNMMDDYSLYIDAKSKAKFEKRLKVNESENEARTFLQNIRGKTPDEQVRLIEGIKDSETRSEAIKIKHLDSTKLKALKKNSENKNYERVHGVVDQLRDSGQLYTEKSITDHPEIKMILQKASLNPTQMRVLREEFKSPKISEDKALDRVTDIFLGGDLQKMTSAQLSEAMVGLSKSDKSKFRTKFLSRTSDKKGAERTSQIYNRSKSLLTDKMYASGMIENVDGFLDDDDFLKLKKAKVELLEYLDNAELGDKPSMGTINSHIDDFIKSKKKESIFDKVSFGNWFKSKVPAKKSNSKKARRNPLEGEDTFEWQRRYKKERGLSTPPRDNDPDFLNYVRENK
jgi:hypothetical protein